MQHELLHLEVWVSSTIDQSCKVQEAGTERLNLVISLSSKRVDQLCIM